jgi:hypothetical protein
MNTDFERAALAADRHAGERGIGVILRGLLDILQRSPAALTWR